MAQQKQEVKSDSYLSYSWKKVATQMPEEWYGSGEAKMVADSVLKYQTEAGGWPKNSGYHRSVNQEEMDRTKLTGIGATFDNGATLTEITFLSKMYAKKKDERYRDSFEKAINYIFKAQYNNGGWPQYYPFRKKKAAYSSHITYNDNAMVNVMLFLRDVFSEDPKYAHMQISEEMKTKARSAFDKGVECILKTQIVNNDEPTVWCAQHDEVTFAPAKARSYELPSFSGQESVSITLLLMDIKNPSQEIVNAVKGAVRWFEKNKLEGLKVVTFTNEEGKKDKKVVADSTASPLWARFYDLETEKPFFSDRDGIKKITFAELGYNRRNGYIWYTTAPEKVIKRYPKWIKKWVE